MPHLPQAGGPHLRAVPGLRHPPASARPPRRRGTGLPGLRRHHPGDGTGHVSAALAPLLAALTTMQTPDTGLTWISAPHVRELLSGLATGKVALTHQALAAQPRWRAVAHLRDLLMSCGVLPPADKQLLHFETWLHRHLAGAPAGPATRLLRQYVTWHQLPRLRARAAARPLTPAACSNAISQVRAATRFLAWAGEHDPGPARLSQAGLDTWHATCGQRDQASARPFLTWAVKTGHLPRLTLPPVKAPPGRTPITQQRRLHLLRRALTHSQAPVRTRAAACLTLLFAQPPARIVRLTIDDIIHGDDGQILLRLRDPPPPHQPRQPVAVPRPPRRPAAAPRDHGRAAQRVRHPHPRRAHRHPAPARPPGPRPRHRPGPRLPPQHRPPARGPGRRTLGPLRPRG